jgi:hypothetical protein
VLTARWEPVRLSPNDLKRRSKEFWLVIRDDDKKEILVEGAMTNDDPWNKAVRQAQKQGRSVRRSSSSIGNTEEYIKRYWVSQGYKEA